MDFVLISVTNNTMERPALKKREVKVNIDGF
jgi:hypothetical protein